MEPIAVQNLQFNAGCEVNRCQWGWGLCNVCRDPGGSCSRGSFSQDRKATTQQQQKGRRTKQLSQESVYMIT